MPIGIGAATLAGGALSAGGSLIGSGKASSAAKSSAEMQQQQANLTRATLAPFVAAGGAVAPAYAAAALSGPTGGGPDYLTQAAGMVPGQMTQAELEQTPGYQWTLAQNLKGIQSQASARGLGVSGAALKGAAQYATGLANQTYKDQFALAQQRFADVQGLSQQQQSNLNSWLTRLGNAAGLGENAAAGAGQATSQLYAGAGNALTNAGVLSGAGLTGATNALNSGINNYLGYNQYQQQIAQQNNPTAAGWDTSGNAGVSMAGQQGWY